MTRSNVYSQESMQILVPPDTGRLSFRPVREDDHDGIGSIYADPQAQRFHPGMNGPAKIQRFIDRQLGRYREFGYGFWIIESLHEHRLVGCAGLTWQRTDRGEVLEVGYALLARERGQGYATEAALACRDFGFNVLGASRIASLIHKDNAPSVAVASRVHKQHRCFFHPDLKDEYLMYYTDAQEHEKRA